MLENLKFVQGAVKGKTLLPVLSHFRIKDGTITGSNGILTMSAPCDFDINANPEAVAFAKGITACRSKKIDMTVTGAGSLKLVSGNTSAIIKCTTEVFPEYAPEGKRHKFKDDFLAQLKLLKPFIGVDASRPWCTGVLINGHTLTATNNIVLVQYTSETELSPVPVNLSARVINEMLRIDEMPSSFQLGEKSITFHYSGKRWIRSALLSTSWPPVSDVINGSPINDRFVLDDSFFDDVETLLPQLGEEKRLFISPNFLATHADKEQGTRILVKRELLAAIVQAEQFYKLRGVAECIDFAYYDKPCPFEGENIKGVIVGMNYK